MITEIISTLAAQRASGDSITVTDIFRLIDDLDQDLRAVCDWAVPAICTKSEWNRALAREKRNRTLIEIFGAVPTDAMDFVERYSAAKLVTIYFDGQVSMVPPDRADIEHVERSRWARLCRIAAEKLNLDYSRVAMDDACDEYFEREQAARRVKVMSAISHDPAAKFDWLALAEATCAVDNLHFAAAMMQHFMWQVKRKETALPIENHLMLIFGGAQRVGKSTFVELLFSPIAEMMQPASFAQITDEKIIEIWRAPVIFMDEMAFASKSDADQVKNVITAKVLSRRPMRSNGYDKVRQQSTLIGTTNKVLAQLIRDETGVRRFGYIPFTTTPDRAVINAADYLMAWQSVDEKADSPILPFLDLLIEQQEASRLRAPVEQWGLDLDDHAVRRFVEEQDDRGVINRKTLYADFSSWMDDAGLQQRDRLSLQDFTKELQRLSEMTATALFKYHTGRKSSGWLFTGDRPDGSIRDKLRLVTQ